jgi:hypothetical protein
MAGAMTDDPYAKMDQQFSYQQPQQQQQSSFFPQHDQHDASNGQPMHFPTPASTRDTSPYNPNNLQQNAYGDMHSLVHPAGILQVALTPLKMVMTPSRCFTTQCPSQSTTCLSPTRLVFTLSNSQHKDEYMDNNFIPTFNMEFLKHQQPDIFQQTTKPRLKRADSISSIGGQSDGENVTVKKRFQVKIACIHCKKACKKCDDVRPCTRFVFPPNTSRCVRIGFQNNCTDAPRKERKKGFKRGPYNKGRRNSDGTYDEDWQRIVSLH